MAPGRVRSFGDRCGVITLVFFAIGILHEMEQKAQQTHGGGFAIGEPATVLIAPVLGALGLITLGVALRFMAAWRISPWRSGR
jgi:hypothetical protein